MKIIKRLLAEKILRYYENTDRILALLYRMPGIGKILEKQVVVKGNNIIKHLFGVLVQMAVIGWELATKILFVIIFIWLPYRLFANEYPLIAEERTLVLVYLFFVICTLCGSVANNVISVVNRRDYIMTRVVLVTPAVNYLGKLIYKMITDFVYFVIALCILKLPLHIGIMLSVTTMFARPIGELFTVLMYEKSPLLYNNRGAVYGTIMALSVIVCYGVMFVLRKVSSFWMVVVNPIFMTAVIVLGVVAFLVLCNYRNYSGILKNAIATK